MKTGPVVLLIAAIAVVVAVEYRLSLPDEPQSFLATDGFPLRQSPSFAGYDAELHLFRLKSYIGRHSMFVVFCGQHKDVMTEPNVSHLIKRKQEVASKGFLVIVVASGLPQEYRSLQLPDGFELVCDFEQAQDAELFRAHRSFSCYNEKDQKPKPNIFFVDRLGNVPFNAERPMPLASPPADIDQLLGVIH